MSTFAERELQKYGWERGTGLGKEKQGRKDRVKVSIKNDYKGVGADHDAYSSFQWWDHIYNKSTSQIIVHANDESGQVTMSSSAKNNGLVSYHRPSAVLDDQIEQENLSGENVTSANDSTSIYSMFVKSAPLVPTSLLGVRDTCIDLKQQVDGDMCILSKMTDLELFTLCEGRTAYKGARSDGDVRLAMGKLERVDPELAKRYEAIAKTIEDLSELETADKVLGKQKQNKKERKRIPTDTTILSEPRNRKRKSKKDKKS